MPYLEASIGEKNIGLELFFTTTPGIAGRLKKTPEDFIVTERSIDVEPITKNELAERDPALPIYTFGRVKSRNWETNRLLMEFSRQLGISYEKIYFAGTKDKRAITSQLMAFEVLPEKLNAIEIPDVEIEGIFQATRSLKIGDLLGNDFEINITDILLDRNELKENLANTEHHLASINGFPNFFGIQRFGVIRPVTHEIGKLILQKNFEDAVWQYIANPVESESKSDYKVRAEFESCWDFEWAIENYPKYLTFERTIIRYLIAHPEDYVGALGQLPKNLAIMFIHAYQSYLFNKILCERIRKEIPINEPVIGDIVLPVDDYKLPVHKTWIPITENNFEKLSRQCKNHKAYVSGVLFGSDSVFSEGEYGEIERKIIETEKLTRDDFIIPDMPQISSKGSRREFLAPIHDFYYEIEEDTVKMKFGLMKGAYATTLLREYLKTDIKSY